MVQYAKIVKPMVDKNGLSDPVDIFTDMGECPTAWWDANTQTWNTVDGESFNGGVLYWVEKQFPKGWNYDSELYGGVK